MYPVSPVIPGQEKNEIMVAENQPEYMNLPVVSLGGGLIMSRWKLDERERELIAETGEIFVLMHTFGQPVTPLQIQVEQPDIEIPNNEPPAIVIATRNTEQVLKMVQDSAIEHFYEQCGRCRHSIIVGKSSLVGRKPEDITFICTVCFENFKTENPSVVVTVEPETAKEFTEMKNNSA